MKGCITVIGIVTHSYLVSLSQSELEIPVGIGKTLAGGADDVCLALSQQVFRLLKTVNTVFDHCRRAVSGHPKFIQWMFQICPLTLSLSLLMVQSC